MAILFSYNKPRGGDPFPLRNPKKVAEIDFNAFIDDSYEPPPPLFELGDFLLKNGDMDDPDQEKEITIQAPFIEKSLIKWHVYEEPNRRPQRDENLSCQKIMLDDNGK